MPDLPSPVSICIPAHPSERSRKYTVMCLQAIELHTDKEKTPYEVIVEEEGSFTEAVNSLCNKAKYDRLVYICNDVVVVPHWLEIMHASWDVVKPDAKPIGQLCTYFTIGGGNWQDAALNRFRQGIVEPCPKIVWMVTMMDKKTFTDVGLMDTEFKGAGAWSDTDISARFIKAGYGNYVAPLIILHFGQGSFNEQWDRLYAESVRGEKRMREKHGADWKKLFGGSG